MIEEGVHYCSSEDYEESLRLLESAGAIPVIDKNGCTHYSLERGVVSFNSSGDKMVVRTSEHGLEDKTEVKLR